MALNCEVEDYKKMKNKYPKLADLVMYNINILAQIPPRDSKLSLVLAKKLYSMQVLVSLHSKIES